MGLKHCMTCGTDGPTKTQTRGSVFIEILLWICFLVPGLIYSIWRLTTRSKVCRACGAENIVPLNAPAAIGHRNSMAASRGGVIAGEITSSALVFPDYANFSGMLDQGNAYLRNLLIFLVILACGLIYLMGKKNDAERMESDSLEVRAALPSMAMKMPATEAEIEQAHPTKHAESAAIKRPLELRAVTIEFPPLPVSGVVINTSDMKARQLFSNDPEAIARGDCFVLSGTVAQTAYVRDNKLPLARAQGYLSSAIDKMPATQEDRQNWLAAVAAVYASDYTFGEIDHAIRPRCGIGESS